MALHTGRGAALMEVGRGLTNVGALLARQKEEARRQALEGQDRNLRMRELRARELAQPGASTLDVALPRLNERAAAGPDPNATALTPDSLARIGNAADVEAQINFRPPPPISTKGPGGEPVTLREPAPFMTASGVVQDPRAAREQQAGVTDLAAEAQRERELRYGKEDYATTQQRGADRASRLAGVLETVPGLPKEVPGLVRAEVPASSIDDIMRWRSGGGSGRPIAPTPKEALTMINDEDEIIGQNELGEPVRTGTFNSSFSDRYNRAMALARGGSIQPPAAEPPPSAGQPGPWKGGYQPMGFQDAMAGAQRPLPNVSRVMMAGGVSGGATTPTIAPPAQRPAERTAGPEVSPPIGPRVRTPMAEAGPRPAPRTPLRNPGATQAQAPYNPGLFDPHKAKASARAQQLRAEGKDPDEIVQIMTSEGYRVVR